MGLKTKMKQLNDILKLSSAQPLIQSFSALKWPKNIEFCVNQILFNKSPLYTNADLRYRNMKTFLAQWYVTYLKTINYFSQIQWIFSQKSKILVHFPKFFQ